MNKDQESIYNNYRMIWEQSSDWKSSLGSNVQPDYKERTVTAVDRANKIHNPLDPSKLKLVANAIYSIKELSSQEKNTILTSFASPEFIKGFTASTNQQMMQNQQASSGPSQQDPDYIDPDQLYKDIKANRESEAEGKRGGIDVTAEFLHGPGGNPNNRVSEYGEYNTVDGRRYEK